MATPIRSRQPPYQIKVSRQLADHTMIEAVFAEDDDTRAQQRIAHLLDTFDERMQATNRVIVASNQWVETERARLKSELERERADALNGATDGDSHRTPHVPADP